jgi:hypothetical protein
MADY